MKALINIVKFIINHPISGKSKITSLFRFIWWQFRCLLTSKPYVHTFSPNSKLIVNKGMTGATGNLYCGLHEYSEMLFLLHYLRKGDVFIDVGANIGSYTLLASAENGAKSYCFEPVPSTFQQLKDNISINKIDGIVKLYNLGLASQKGELLFSLGNDSSMNHVRISNEKNEHTVSVEIDSLDNVLKGVHPNLLKIDVEGFEQEVLLGAKNLLASNSLKAIIIELNSSGLKYGVTDVEIHLLLQSYSFQPYTYHPFTRTLDNVNYTKHQNIIYIRDVEVVMERVQQARKIKILNLEI
jgi:FkbM family methyltransferase